jgi:hypothetical protein
VSLFDFLNQTYHKVLVVWSTEDNEQIPKIAQDQYQIKVIEMRTILNELLQSTRGSGSRDDVLRIFELISLAKKEEDKLKKEIAKKVKKVKDNEKRPAC